MAKVSAAASLGIKINLEHKKAFNRGDYANPFYSMSIEREVDSTLTDEELADKAEELAQICRERVERRINKDIQDLQNPKT